MTRTLALLVILAACYRPSPPIPATEQQQRIATAACGGGCESSTVCGDAFGNCHYCDRGVCTAILPAHPSVDAGVDAPPATTSP